MNAFAERAQELQLAGVTRLYRARIRANPHVQAEDRANPCQLRNRRGGVDGSLDPSNV